MPHAELHGKLSSSGANAHERSEDLLTSDVFGRLRYLEPGDGLLPVLARAESFAGGTPLKLPAPAGGAVTYEFWPRMDEAEPDVLLTWKTSDGNTINVVVECKHLSGKSGAFVPNAEDQAAEAASAGADQLRREFHGLQQLGGQGILLYITGHRTLPRGDFAEQWQAFLLVDPVGRLLAMGKFEVEAKLRATAGALFAEGG